MAASKSNHHAKKDITELEKKIKTLEAENQALKHSAETSDNRKPKKPYEWLRKSTIIFFLTLSVVMFMLFNLSSWVKNTILDTDTFVATMQPVIAEPVVQQTLQNEITTSLFESIDVQSKLQSVLPENVAFLSGPLASQIESYTSTKVGDVLASQQIYDLWGTVLGTVHAKVIGYIQNDSADGVISVNDVYVAVSNRISEDSRLSFLTNKQLPEKVGTITLAEISWLPEARKYVDTIAAAPILFLGVSLVSFLIAVLLSVNKKRTTLAILVLSIVMMFATGVALMVSGTYLENSVSAEYSEFARTIYDTITNPLMNRTLGYASLLGAIALVMIVSSDIAWIKNSRVFVDVKILAIAQKFLPEAKAPMWLKNVSDYITVIAWTVFIVLFVVIGVRIPPEASEVKNGIIWASLSTLLLYIVHLVVRAMSEPRNKK